MATALGVFAYRCQCVEFLALDPETFFKYLGNAIDSAVLVAVMWEVLTDMIFATIRKARHIKEGMERGRRESDKEWEQALREAGFTDEQIRTFRPNVSYGRAHISIDPKDGS